MPGANQTRGRRGDAHAKSWRARISSRGKGLLKHLREKDLRESVLEKKLPVLSTTKRGVLPFGGNPTGKTEKRVSEVWGTVKRSGGGGGSSGARAGFYYSVKK